jgi:hypothetical protein
LYPRPGRVSNAVFAWEFLRRNEQYQNEWSGYVNTLREGARNDPELLRFIEALTADDSNAVQLQEEYAVPAVWNRHMLKLSAMPCFDVSEMLPGGRTLIQPLEQRLGKLWGLEHLANPGRSYSQMEVRFSKRKMVIQPTSHGLAGIEKDAARTHPERFGLAQRATQWHVLQIDLEMPLEVIEQLVLDSIRRERAFRIRKGWIKPIEQRARAPALLVDYLRILDAKASGENVGKIGEVLYPRERNESPEYTRTKKVREAYKAACQIRDHGFRTLPLLADKLTRNME